MAPLRSVHKIYTVCAFRGNNRLCRSFIAIVEFQKVRRRYDEVLAYFRELDVPPLQRPCVGRANLRSESAKSCVDGTKVIDRALGTPDVTDIAAIIHPGLCPVCSPRKVSCWP